MGMNEKAPPRLLPVLIVCLAASLSAAGSKSIGAAPDTTVYLVRHAEKQAAPADDPPLTEAGQARAAALAGILKPLGVKAIFISQYLRTRETVRPLAEAVGLTPIVAPMISDPAAPGGILERSIRELAARVFDHRGEAVLIVGHSNSLPLIIRALGGTPVPDISDSEYDNLFILTISENGDVTLARRKYGRPD